MGPRMGAAGLSAMAIAAVAVTVVVSNGPSGPTAPRAAAASAARTPSASPPRARFGGAREDCSTRSEARFPGAFSSPRNLMVGPLVLIGGAYTDAGTVRRFGGNKFPLLVKAGHVVTVRLSRRARRIAGLAYGPQPEGETKLRTTHRSVTFVACRPGRASPRYSPDGPSSSDADGVAVTFWSGFVLTRTPACLPLDVYVDDTRAPRRVGLALGRRCAH